MDGCELRASSRDYDFLVPGSFSPTVMETQRWRSSQTKGYFSTVPQVHGRSRYPTSCTSAGLLFRFVPFIPFHPLLIYTASRRKLRVAAASSHWKEKCVGVQTAGEIISWKLPCGGIQGASNMRWPGAEPEHSNYIYIPSGPWRPGKQSCGLRSVGCRCRDSELDGTENGYIPSRCAFPPLLPLDTKD